MSHDAVVVGAGLAGLAAMRAWQTDGRDVAVLEGRVALGDGLFVCGDHRDTPSIQGALFSGRRCGEAVASMLTGGASI